ncbi:MAG TPA: LPS export ABC transporter periplasmic protein LptC [Candidatus Baltobacteraceae bacterium]|nr:LPS export ABC transporter periplasmic protein LptC [Candidatus Baltobacteraceae bacterium]
MRTRLLVILLAVAMIAAAPKPRPSNAPNARNVPAAGFTFSDWNVKTDQFDFNWQSGQFNAPNPVTLTRPGSTIQADRAFGNQKSKQATLTGHVVLHDRSGALSNFSGQTGSHQPSTLTCDNLMIDGVTKSYVATGSVHFIQGANDVRADRAVMNGLTHDLHLYGHVQLQQ